MTDMVHIANLMVRRSETFTLQIPLLKLGSGIILCVAGPNGSGKTTLIDCLAGLLSPGQGSVTLAGKRVNHNVRNTKAMVGFVPDDDSWLIQGLCATEYFALLARIYQNSGVTTDMHARSLTLARLLHFSAFNQPLHTLSHGNKKKVQLIAGLMHEPAVLIIDEVRNGLDPLAIITVEQLLRAEIKRGACIIAATHDLWWAERIASSVLLLIHGKPQLFDTIETTVQRHGSLEQAFLRLVQGPYADNVEGA